MNTNRTKKTEESLPAISYSVDGMPVSLEFGTIKELICRGQRHTPSDEEVVAFMQFCRYMEANPFIQDAYLIKYDGNKPASFVLGVDFHVKKGEEHSQYDGYEAGVIVEDRAGSVIDRVGAFLEKGDELLGGWCKVYRKDLGRPILVRVNLSRYQKMRYDEKGNLVPQSLWKTNDADMIVKVAISQAFRKAFPKRLRGGYTEPEIRADDNAPSEVREIEDLEETKIDEEAVKREALDFFAEKGFVVGKDFSEEDMTAYMEGIGTYLNLSVAETYRRAMESASSEEGWVHFLERFRSWRAKMLAARTTVAEDPGSAFPSPPRRRGRPRKGQEAQRTLYPEAEEQVSPPSGPGDVSPDWEQFWKEIRERGLDECLDEYAAMKGWKPTQLPESFVLGFLDDPDSAEAEIRSLGR